VRKRWRYVAAFSDELMLCAARVRVGPFGQTFFALLDRGSGELIERTRTRLPGATGEVRQAEPGGSAGPSEVLIESPILSGSLAVGDERAWEARCRNGEGDDVWTRKRAGVAVKGEMRSPDGRRWAVDALGVIDETDGHHPRHTVWSWSAGVGRSDDGRAVAWNLVEGVNDSPQDSERAVWVGGEPFEPGPVRFAEDLSEIELSEGGKLEFHEWPGAVREDRTNLIVLRSWYRQPFGTFSGELPGALRLAEGYGVMESHVAAW
jgi:hypothetical protein